MKEIINEGFKVRFVCPMKLTILKTAVTSPFNPYRMNLCTSKIVIICYVNCALIDQKGSTKVNSE